MLVVSRKKNESVIVVLPDGRTVAITVCRIKRESVRIGIEAPIDVTVVRSELAGGEQCQSDGTDSV